MIVVAYVGTLPCDHPRWSAVEFLKTLGLCKNGVLKHSQVMLCLKILSENQSTSRYMIVFN